MKQRSPTPAGPDPNGGPKESGFTLVEIIAALVILAVLTAVAIGRTVDSPARVVAATDKLKSHLRNAQLRAMHSDQSWGVVIEGNQYWLFADSNTGDPIMFLGEEQNTVILNGVTVSSGTGTISFDEWGTPYNGSNPGTDPALSTAWSTTISQGVNSETLTITPDTGFIP